MTFNIFRIWSPVAKKFLRPSIFTIDTLNNTIHTYDGATPVIIDGLDNFQPCIARDKDDLPIYEGDIVKYSSYYSSPARKRIAEVFFDPRYRAYLADRKNVFYLQIWSILK